MENLDSKGQLAAIISSKPKDLRCNIATVAAICWSKGTVFPRSVWLSFRSLANAILAHTLKKTRESADTAPFEGFVE